MRSLKPLHAENSTWWAAWSVDRLGRSLRDLIDFLNELRGAAVDLYLHQQAIDTSTPAGRALFQMMA